MTATDDKTLSVAEVMATVAVAVVSSHPHSFWIRGEVASYRRTSNGAVYFQLADLDDPEVQLSASMFGVRAHDLERKLDDAGVGRLGNGLEIRAKGAIHLDQRRSEVRFSLIDIDPSFTVGQLAMQRRALLQVLKDDGSLERNGKLLFPPVPLRVGLITSRGSAAHSDFLHQLGASGYRFQVATVHSGMQGETAGPRLVTALKRLAATNIDVAVITRGGGSQLDLSVFDTEDVARAVTEMDVPVVTGIGHHIDRTVVDEVAHTAVKTPTAAAELLVSKVADFDTSLHRARTHIAAEARRTWERHQSGLAQHRTTVVGATAVLDQQRMIVDHRGDDIADTARSLVEDAREEITGLEERIGIVGPEPTLARGYGLVTDDEGRVVHSVTAVTEGDVLDVKLSDGTIKVKVVG